MTMCRLGVMDELIFQAWLGVKEGKFRALFDDDEVIFYAHRGLQMLFFRLQLIFSHNHIIINTNTHQNLPDS